MRKWCKTSHPGVRYRTDERKLYRGAPDRYFSIRFFRNGKTSEEGLGWASEGWTATKAAGVRADLQKAYTTGDGPDTLASKREKERVVREEQSKAVLLLEKDTVSYKELVEDHYIAWAKGNKKSWADDETRLRLHIYPVIGMLSLKEITSGIIDKFRDDLLKTKSRATVLQILALLRKTFNFLGKKGVHELRNPIDGVDLPKIDNACERFFTRDEFDNFISAAAKLKNMDLHDASILAVNTGLRLGEINRLVAADVDLDHGFLTVRETGGKPGGKVPLNSFAANVLRKRMEGGKAGALFRTTRDGDREMSRRFARLARKLGLNTGDEDRKHRLTFHSLRHTFASWLALNDVDLYRIQKLMRHKTFSMVQRYAHLRPSWLRDDVELLCSPPSPEDSDKP